MYAADTKIEYASKSIGNIQHHLNTDLENLFISLILTPFYTTCIKNTLIIPKNHWQFHFQPLIKNRNVGEGK